MTKALPSGADTDPHLLDRNREELQDQAVGWALAYLRETVVGQPNRQKFTRQLESGLDDDPIDGQRTVSYSLLTQVELGKTSNKTVPEWLVKAVARTLEIDEWAILLTADEALKRFVGSERFDDDAATEVKRDNFKEFLKELSQELRQEPVVDSITLATGALDLYRSSASIDMQRVALLYFGVILRMKIDRQVAGKAQPSWVKEGSIRANRILEDQAIGTPQLHDWRPSSGDRLIRTFVRDSVEDWDPLSLLLLVTQTWIADPFTPHDPFGPKKGKTTIQAPLTKPYSKANDEARLELVRRLLNEPLADAIRAANEDQLAAATHSDVAEQLDAEIRSAYDKASEGLKDSDNRLLPGYVLAGGAVGALIVMSGGLLAAPAIAGAIGGAAGLSGAAAVSSGLAALGGGAVTAGGAGVMGGMAVIGGTAALVGGSAGLAIGGVAWASSHSERLRTDLLVQWAAASLIAYARPDGAERLLATMVQGAKNTLQALEATEAHLLRFNSPEATNLTSLSESISNTQHLLEHIQERLEWLESGEIE